MTLRRAWCTLTIKSIDEDARTFEGIASTPKTDRMDDIVEPMGAKFSLPIPLLWQHGRGLIQDPVGWVTHAEPNEDGIPVRGKFAKPKPDYPQTLIDELNSVWVKVRDGLVRGLSIGFNPLEWSDIKGSYGYRYTLWDWLELSAVTIAANTDATITSVKSADLAQLAAFGDRPHGVVRLATKSPGAAGQTAPERRSGMKTIQEQIVAFEAKRAASEARMSAIMAKSAEDGTTLDAAQSEEYDGLEAEVKSIDAHLVRLRAHEALVVARAAAGGAGTAALNAAEEVTHRVIQRHAPSGIVSVANRLEQGIPFVRYMKAMVQAKGILPLALQLAEANKRWRDESPEVAVVLKAAVAAGDTTTPGWAAELVYNQNIASAFLEFLRPKTILGKLTGFTKVPFNVRWGTQTGGSTSYWVGQGLPVPVSKLSTGADSLAIAKAAGMVVLDKELMMSSEPSAEVLVRNDLSKEIVKFLDQHFIGPEFAAVANVNPASVTNGVAPIPPTGTDSAALRKDVQTLFATWDAENFDGQGAAWVTTPKVARSISLMLNSLGQPVFPTVSPDGGTFLGYPMVVSGAAMSAGSPSPGHMLVLIAVPEVAMADEGQIVIDASEEAAIQMLDNPTNQSTGATVATAMVSMWQTHSVALRAVRFINWKKRRPYAVQYIDDAAYVT